MEIKLTGAELRIMMALLAYIASRFWQTADPARYIKFILYAGREGDALCVLVPWIPVCQPLLVLPP